MVFLFLRLLRRGTRGEGFSIGNIQNPLAGGGHPRESKSLNERSVQGMRAVYLVLFVALILALGAYPESESSAYVESGTSVYFK
jgi:hypothetical protein